MRAALLLYMGTLCARPGEDGGAAQWFVTVHDTDGGPAGGEPFIVAPLRLLPPR